MFNLSNVTVRITGRGIDCCAQPVGFPGNGAESSIGAKGSSSISSSAPGCIRTGASKIVLENHLGHRPGTEN